MSIWTWSLDADLNGSIDGEINARDDAPAREYMPSMRALMASLHAYALDQGGVDATRQSDDLYVVTTNAGIAAPVLGAGLTIRASATNVGAPNLTIDGFGPYPWVGSNGVAYANGTISAGRFYRIAFDPDADAWRTVA